MTWYKLLIYSPVGISCVVNIPTQKCMDILYIHIYSNAGERQKNIIKFVLKIIQNKLCNVLIYLFL